MRLRASFRSMLTKHPILLFRRMRRSGSGKGLPIKFGKHGAILLTRPSPPSPPPRLRLALYGNNSLRHKSASALCIYCGRFADYRSQTRDIVRRTPVRGVDTSKFLFSSCAISFPRGDARLRQGIHAATRPPFDEIYGRCGAATCGPAPLSVIERVGKSGRRRTDRRRVRGSSPPWWSSGSGSRLGRAPVQRL